MTSLILSHICKGQPSPSLCTKATLPLPRRVARGAEGKEGFRPSPTRPSTMSMIRPSPVIAIIVACAILYGVRAQSPAAAPGPAGVDCTMVLPNSTDCLSYVQAGSNLSAPDKACCPELASLVDNYPICLCELLGGAFSSYGITIDTARALKLPSVCHVTTPSVSTCSELGIPVPSPMSPSMAPGGEYPSSGRGPELPAGSLGSPAPPPSGNHGNPCFRGIEIMLVASFSFIVAVVGVL